MRLISLLIALAMLSVPHCALAIVGTANQITFQNGTIALVTPLAVGQGGTGASTLTIHGVLMGETTSAIVASAAGTSGQAFISGGAGADGAYGDLGVAHGGTGATTLGIHGVLVGETTSAIVSVGTSCTSGNVLTCNSGGGADPSFQAVVAGNAPVLAFGSGSDITTSQTIFAGFGGGIDLTEGTVQNPSPIATYKNLRCVNSTIQGTGGATHDIVVTARTGACGSQTSGTLTCTIVGTAAANQACFDTTNSAAIGTAGFCIDFQIATPSAISNNARVNCVVERTA